MPYPTRPSQIAVIPREEFLAERWHHKKGQHVTLLGATQSGKTTLAFQLLEHSCSPAVPGVVMCMKNRDQTVTDFIKRTGWKRVSRLPTTRLRWWEEKPSGHVVWPRLPGDPDEDDAVLDDAMTHATLWTYKKGDRNLFSDEASGLAELSPRIKRAQRAIWARGASHGAANWAASQRPVAIDHLAYNGAEHLFLAYEADAQNRKRYGEIGGGQNPKLIEATTAGLGPYYWLYLRKSDRTLCIITP